MIKVFEMFSGVGGTSFALKRLGIPFEVIGYSEVDKHAIEVYNLNHKGIKNFGDCKKIDTKILPDFDLLTGGFPCQSFSVAGGTKGGRKGFDDTRGILFFEIIRIAKEKKPKYMVLENVKGLFTHEQGKTFKIVLKSLKESGYDVLYKVMNSRDYGIPQNRERIWLVCKLGSWDFWEFNFPEKRKLKINVRDLLLKGVDRKPIKNKRIELILKSWTGRKNMLFEFKGKRGSHPELPPSGLSRQTDRIYSLKYSPCLNHTQREYLFFNDGDVITLLPDEAFRLMGFYPNEIKLGNLNDDQKFKLAGNGWDINVVSKIFKNLYKNLK